MKFTPLSRFRAAPVSTAAWRYGRSSATLALAAACLSLGTVTALAADAAKTDTTKAAAPASDTAKATDTAKTDADKAAAPAAADTPVWVIIEEDVWVPLQFSPLEALDAALSHYRHAEERAAAIEVRKAVAWLKLAASHAEPDTQKQLLHAAAELRKVERDLAAGAVLAANALDKPLARASHALAKWHLDRALEGKGPTEAQMAGKDLLMAAHYLRQAADTAHVEFGKDTDAVVTRIWENGKLTTNKKETTHNYVAKDLEGVEKALHELGTTLK